MVKDHSYSEREETHFRYYMDYSLMDKIKRIKYIIVVLRFMSLL